MDEDGDKLRMMKLGFDRATDSTEKWVCPSCGSTFHCERALKTHVRLGQCASYTDLTTERQRALRKSRMVGKYRRGVVEKLSLLPLFL